MKKVYLNELTPEQVTERLQKGEIIHSVAFPVIEYKIINGIVCRTDRRSITYNASFIIPKDNQTHYFEEQEPLTIEVKKFYKTHDGRCAICYAIDTKEEYPCKFAVIGEYEIFSTTKKGTFHINKPHKNDIVSEWED